ncbi:MAG: hypothetical protein ACYDFT_03635 [Thermoplasmata archaeon]
MARRESVRSPVPIRRSTSRSAKPTPYKERRLLFFEETATPPCAEPHLNA